MSNLGELINIVLLIYLCISRLVDFEPGDTFILNKQIRAGAGLLSVDLVHLLGEARDSRSLGNSRTDNQS